MNRNTRGVSSFYIEKVLNSKLKQKRGGKLDERKQKNNERKRGKQKDKA